MHSRALRDDSGLTLVELIVTVSVAVLIIGVMTGVFINGVTAQREGVARDTATGAATVVATSLSVSIRNASDVRVSGDGTRLDAVYIAPDGTAECRAWEFLSGVGESALVYRASRAGALPPADATWGPLATGVVGSPDPDVVFTEVGAQGVQVGMAITSDGITVAVTDGVTAQAVSGESLTCWE